MTTQSSLFDYRLDEAPAALADLHRHLYAALDSLENALNDLRQAQDYTWRDLEPTTYKTQCAIDRIWDVLEAEK